MFANFQDLYSFMSSAGLNSQVSQTAKKFREMYRSRIIPRPTVSQAKQQTISVSEPGFMIYFFKEAELYLESDEVQQNADDDDDSKIDDIKNQAQKLHTFASTCLNFPFVSHYSDFAKSMNQAIEHAMLMSFDDANTLSLLREFDSLLMDYADKLSYTYDEEYYELEGPQNVHNLLSENCWDINNHSELKYLDDEPIENADFASINKLIANAHSPDLPDAVIKYMLNPIIGTAGLAVNHPTCSPIYTTVFPPMYLQQHAKTIWNSRAAKMSPKPLPPSQYADTFQTHCESVFLDKLRKQTIHSTFHDKVKAHTTKPDDNDSSNPGLSFSSTGQSSFGKGKTGTGGQSPSGGSSGPTPTVPDDSSYQPDLLLAQLALEMTNEYRNDKNRNMVHDHMTRFKTTSESSTTMSWPMMNLGGSDTDWWIQKNQRGVKTQYLVTFTRKSMKPIFSQIS